MRRCSFFFDVFGLELPDYLHCQLFSDSIDSNQNECVGMAEYKEAKQRERRPVSCSGFYCDKGRCIPSDWRCDGHVDCADQTDESHCDVCGENAIHCGEGRCMGQKHVCDGVQDCPYGQDERNCSKLFRVGKLLNTSKFCFVYSSSSKRTQWRLGTRNFGSL